MGGCGPAPQPDLRSLHVIYTHQSHGSPGGAGRSINLTQLSVSECSKSPPSTPSSINSAPLVFFPLMETHRRDVIESVCLTTYSHFLLNRRKESRAKCVTKIFFFFFFVYFVLRFPSGNAGKGESEEVDRSEQHMCNSQGS